MSVGRRLGERELFVVTGTSTNLGRSHKTARFRRFSIFAICMEVTSICSNLLAAPMKLVISDLTFLCVYWDDFIFRFASTEVAVCSTDHFADNGILDAVESQYAIPCCSASSDPRI